jgi:hypothetical protein
MGEEQRNLEVEGGAEESRRPTGVAPAGGAMRGGLAPGQRFTLPASFPRSVALAQLPFDSLSMA